MRALFLIPGDELSQVQALPAAAAVASQLGFALQVACAPALAPLWKLLPAVEKTIPFDFRNASLADWANLLGSVREPDFQVCINLARGRQVDLMLSMSHIPTRIAAAGFSATSRVAPTDAGWPAQALQAYLQPIGVTLAADAFRLALPPELLREAQASLPAGDGPMLLLAPAGVPGDWPAEQWQRLPQRIRSTLPGLRSLELPPATAATALRRAALVAASDVVLASDPLSEELALLCGVPLVALGREDDSLPRRDGVKGLTSRSGLGALSSDDVLAALGLA
ncbi:glycosyltransferase family 9 protein [Synechococcus sp. CBW1004]|jgi:ADP-heptose:LPS heptosyltransferase|uniref:glycosyltransferase family 9 protein n=1 Tax=Synechococcus sp. CBW1004 TaxID=1353136 RepID=UPI0018CEA875|nr:lipopolysaccharide heptosyltransferase family protein [Synechococcus sp. CBW1004]QPN64614.1 lipopolysaccharide heptosyltransferase family protein [Synechococcus sp. CBW1004]